MVNKKQKLMIIDGNALIHRSFHALPPTMRTKAGEPTNAVYGFVTVFMKALREFKPDYVALTLDRKEPTFRHEQYKEYKATRVKAPDELYAQIPRVKELARAFGVPIYEQAGFEADDLIGTIAVKADAGVDKIIVTGDMDTLQLVNGDTRVYTMSRGLSDSVLYDEEAVIGRYGLRPDQMIDYKALRGDPSDNIPGVKGIGEKTAVELLSEFGTLDGVYKNLGSDKIKDRIRGLLEEYKDNAYMSRELATIKCDVNIDFKLDDAAFGRFDADAVAQLLSELEFKSLLPRVHDLIGKQSGTGIDRTGGEAIDKFERNRLEFNYRLIDTEKAFTSFLNKLKKQKQFTFDTETTGFDPLVDRLLGISFSWKEGEAYYIQVESRKLKVESGGENNLFNYKTLPGLNTQTPEKAHPWVERLRPIFQDAEIKKFGHNIKFDIKVMHAAGVKTAGVAFDTMIASYLLNPGSRQLSLDAVTFAELGFEKISKDDLLGKGKEKKSFGEVETEKLALYSCEDADFTNRLVGKLDKEIRKQKLSKLFSEIEMPLVPVLAAVEENGILLDTGFLSEISKKMTRRLAAIEKKIYEEAGTKFNINSTQQLREVLFNGLGLPSETISRTKTGLSTAADELDKLKDFHPIIRQIQEQRELTKLLSTYVDALPQLVNAKTGRLHTSFNQTIAATGRLSSTEPNLQNIPVRTELGREIRKAFIAADGCTLLSLDYSQIELRLAAHMSGDKKLVKAFREGRDIHTATAAEINRLELSEVTNELRREAKAINFGILYGQGPHGLAQTADIPYARAKEFIDKYFEVYKDVKEYIDATIAQAREQGYVETLFGRRRYLPELNSSVVQVRKAAERMAVNTPLQGTAADMIKLAMLKAQDLIYQDYAVSARMILQVHDELLFEVKNGIHEELAIKMKRIMEEVVKLAVPVVVDIKSGSNWGEMEEVV